MKRIAVLIGTVLLVQGCSYAISSDLAAKADKTLTFSRIESDPPLYQGTLVILGGTIAKTVVLTDHSSLIEVEQQELDHWGRPLARTNAGGRFLVLHGGVLNVLLYAAGRQITIAGVVQGISRQGIDDTSSSFLVISSREIKLWPREPATWSRPSYLDPLLYDPYASRPGY